MPTRQFSVDFKTSAVQLVQVQGYSVRGAAKSLGIDPSTLRGWIRKFGTNGKSGADAPTSEVAIRDENRKLREEVRRLRISFEKKRTSGSIRYQRPYAAISAPSARISLVE